MSDPGPTSSPAPALSASDPDSELPQLPIVKLLNMSGETVFDLEVQPEQHAEFLAHDSSWRLTIGEMRKLVSAALREKSSVYKSALENAVEDKFGDIVNLQATITASGNTVYLPKDCVELYRSKDTGGIRYWQDKDDGEDCCVEFKIVRIRGIKETRGPVFQYRLQASFADGFYHLGIIDGWDYQETDNGHGVKFVQRGSPAFSLRFLDAREGVNFCRALKSYKFATRFHTAAPYYYMAPPVKSVVLASQSREVNIEFLRAFHRDEIGSSLQTAENGATLYQEYELYEPFVLNEESIKFASVDADSAGAEFLSDGVEIGDLVVEASGETAEGRRIVSLHMVLPAGAGVL